MGNFINTKWEKEPRKYLQTRPKPKDYKWWRLSKPQYRVKYPKRHEKTYWTLYERTHP
jgi:hypothetical protein